MVTDLTFAFKPQGLGLEAFKIKSAILQSRREVQNTVQLQDALL